MELRDKDQEETKNPNEFGYKKGEELQQPERHEVEGKNTEKGANAGYQQQNEVETPSQNDNPSTEHTTLHTREVDFQPSTHGRSTGRMVGHEPGIDNGI